MARCGCSGSTCNCLIQGGQFINVSGSGTLNDPYIISADGVDISDAIQFIDTGTINFTVTGSGTDANPYQVRAAAQVSVNELTDANVPSPSPNDVLTWDGSEWVASPVSAEPGAVITGTSITGDGTTANPFEINIIKVANRQLTGAGTDADPLSTTLIVPTGTYAEDTPYTDWPQGHTILSGGTADWFDGRWASQVEDWQMPANWATQFATPRTSVERNQRTLVRYGYNRTVDGVNAPGWTRWMTVASQAGVQTIAGGLVVVPGSTSDVASLRVTFESGQFTHTPGVFVQLRSESIGIDTGVGSVSPEGFTVFVDRPSGSDSQVFWVAISNFTNLE